MRCECINREREHFDLPFLFFFPPWVRFKSTEYPKVLQKNDISDMAP